MAYTINKTNGSVLTTIADGTIDNTTDLTLIGKNYSGYGELLNENLVKLLENFASSSAPANKLAGQLWWDTTNGLLKVYNGSTFKIISGSTASSSAPTGATTGDLWWDTTNTQLKVYNGASWTTIGPSFTATTGTSGAVVDTVTDSVGTSHVVVKLFVNNSIVGMISKDGVFTPQVAIGGFAQIYPGIQLSTGVSGATFRGDSTNAQLLDSLDSSQFLRSDAADTTSGTLGIKTDAGMTIGADDDLSLTVSGSNTLFKNATSDGDMIFRITKSAGGETTAMTIDGATGTVELTATFATGNNNSQRIATTAYVDTYTLYRDGSKNITGDLLPNANATAGVGRSIGSTSLRFQNIWGVNLNGTAVAALYSDVAERFAADAPYGPGTIVELGGDAEITVVNDELSENVFGVISDKPAYLMNSQAGDNDTHPPVAMTGRVPVKVRGQVRKGDRLVSAGAGLARAARANEANSFNSFGRALEDKLTDGEGVVLSVVTVH